MNLENPTRANIEYIMNEIKKKLTMANTAVMNPDSFDLDVYEDLLYLYQMISKKDRFSISEMEAIVNELGSMRKK